MRFREDGCEAVTGPTGTIAQPGADFEADVATSNTPKFIAAAVVFPENEHFPTNFRLKS
jgi:hypothetical protein